MFIVNLRHLSCLFFWLVHFTFDPRLTQNLVIVRASSVAVHSHSVRACRLSRPIRGHLGCLQSQLWLQRSSARNRGSELFTGLEKYHNTGMIFAKFKDIVTMLHIDIFKTKKLGKRYIFTTTKDINLVSLGWWRDLPPWFLPLGIRLNIIQHLEENRCVPDNHGVWLGDVFHTSKVLDMYQV